MRSYAIGRLHDFASEPFSAGFRTKLYGKHRNGSTQKAPRQQTFKFEEVRGRHHREARLCSLVLSDDEGGEKLGAGLTRDEAGGVADLR